MLEEEADLHSGKSDLESCLADVGQDLCQHEIIRRVLTKGLYRRLDNVAMNVPRDARLLL